jgi:hypothetical protein
MTKISALKPLAALVFLCGFLSGCYIPIRFDAEIEIHRTGAYDMKFDGYLASVELYKGLKEGKISRAEEKKRQRSSRLISPATPRSRNLSTSRRATSRSTGIATAT